MKLQSRAPGRRPAFRRGPTALVAALLTTLAGATPQSDPTVGLFRPGRLWTHASGGWGNVGRVVAIGNHGAEVLTEVGGFSASAQLYPATAWDPGAPGWVDTAGYYSENSQVDAAKLASTRATFHILRPTQGASKSPQLRIYSDGILPDAVIPFPFLVSTARGGVHVSEDGERIVAWCYPAPGFKTGLIRASKGAAAIDGYELIDSLGEPQASRLSRDGSTLLLLSPLRTTLVQAATGAVVHQHPTWSGFSTAADLSADGSILVKRVDGSRLEIWQRQAGGHGLVNTLDATGPGPLRRLVLAQDGRFAVAAYDVTPVYPAPQSAVAVRVLSLFGPGPLVQSEHVVLGDGLYTTRVSDLELSADGRHFALATSGDQSGQAPEVVLFSRDSVGAWRVAFEGRTGGSAWDVDLSHDGRRVVVASREGHMDAFGSGARIDTFEVAGRDLILRGTARPGGTVDVLLRCEPGVSVTVLLSDTLAQPPLTIPGAGTLHLAPGTYSFAGVGTADNTGWVQVQVPLAPGSAIGRELFVQGVVRSQRRLTADYGRLRVMP